MRSVNVRVGNMFTDAKAAQVQKQGEAGSIPAEQAFHDHEARAAPKDVIVSFQQEGPASGEAACQQSADAHDTSSTQTCWQTAHSQVQSGQNSEATRARQRLALALARSSVMSVRSHVTSEMALSSRTSLLVLMPSLTARLTASVTATVRPAWAHDKDVPTVGLPAQPP